MPRRAIGGPDEVCQPARCDRACRRRPARRTLGLMKLVFVMALAGFGVGCGGHAEPDPVGVGCVEVASIDDLSPVVDDSFEGADLDGRWFLESPTASYQGNMWLERQGSRLEI